MSKLIEELKNKIDITKEDFELLCEEVKKDPSLYKELSNFIGQPQNINLALLAIQLDPENFEYFKFDLDFISDKKTKKQYENILKIALQYNIDYMCLIVERLIEKHNQKQRHDIKNYSLEDKTKLFNTFAYCYAISPRTLEYLPDEIINNISFHLHMLNIYEAEYDIPDEIFKADNNQEILINKLYNDYENGRVDILEIINTKYFKGFNEYLNKLNDNYKGASIEDFGLNAYQNPEIIKY